MSRVLVAATVAAAHPSWEEYKSQYGLTFEGEEDRKREAAYAANLEGIDANNNANDKSYQLGVNKFTYLAEDEFIQTFTGEFAPEGAKPDDGGDLARFEPSVMEADLADTVDWSTDPSVVPPVEDQGSCGSCWAFAAAGETAIIYAMEFGTMYNLAKQQLVDCAADAWDVPGTGGCQGGLSSLAWQPGGYYPTKGACLTADYPYIAKDQPCQDSCTPVIPPGAMVGFVAIPRGVAELKNALLARPLKVSVNADSTWSSFVSGIAQAPQCYSGTNHAVIAVGYDGDASFKIRNSWGTDWGLKGYINIAQSSSCETGSYSIFYRTPFYPSFAGLLTV
jgi:hypothetical protein